MAFYPYAHWKIDFHLVLEEELLVIPEEIRNNILMQIAKLYQDPRPAISDPIKNDELLTNLTAYYPSGELRQLRIGTYFVTYIVYEWDKRVTLLRISEIPGYAP